MDLSDYVTEHTVFFSTAKQKHRIIEELVKKAFDLEYIKNAPAFKSAIECREAKRSTGIGGGVAIPHARSTDIEKFFVLSAVLERPAEWDAIDQSPVSLVFLIGGPEDDQTTYLRLLSGIMSVVKDTAKRTTIINTREPAALAGVFA